MAYSGKNGVRIKRYTEEQMQNEHDWENPEVDEQAAQLDELVFDSYTGHLQLTVDTQNDGYYSIEVPIAPVESWNEFVDNLPTWVL